MAGVKDPRKGQPALLADFAGRAVRGALEVCVAGRGEGGFVAVVEGQGQRLASEPWGQVSDPPTVVFSPTWEPRSGGLTIALVVSVAVDQSYFDPGVEERSQLGRVPAEVVAGEDKAYG